VPETTLCRLCGTKNAHRATMCAWCETSLVDPGAGSWRLRTDRRAGRGMFAEPQRFNDAMPYGADSSVDRWLSAMGSFLIISTLVCVALACPVAVALLLNKQQAVDEAAKYYSGPPSHSTSEFPDYGALSIIPSLTFALTIYLLFRWITRLRDGDDW
jgi:hypothetical protein